MQRFGLLTVERNLGYTGTVAVTTRISELDQLVAALTTLAGEAVRTRAVGPQQ